MTIRFFVLVGRAVNSSRGLVVWTVIALFAVLGLLRSVSPLEQSGAERFVQSSIDRSYAILDDQNLDASARQQALAAYLPSVVDIGGVALFTLGPYGRDASEEELESFKAAFAELLTSFYQWVLIQYRSGTVRVTGSTPRSHDMIVNATVPNRGGPAMSKFPKASELHIAFRVRQLDQGGYAITDMQVEGIWFALMQRTDSISYLQQHGSSLKLLSVELEKRTESLRSDLADTETR